MTHHFQAPLEKLVSDVFQYHIKVPEEVKEAFFQEDHKRVVATFNDKVKKHCAIMPGGSFYYLLLNKQEVKKLKVQAGEPLQVTLTPDTSPLGMPMPEELEIILDQDEEAKGYFDALTPGKKRSLLHLVGKVKSVDSRVNKALAIAHHLKEVQGVLEYKQLNATIKAYNQRHKLK